MPLFSQTVLTTAYLPPIEYFFAAASGGKVLIEQCEIYQKQSYRSRCRIYSASGAESLSIPILRDVTHKIPIRDVRIDYSEPWLQQHERAMTAAYKSSPFFDYYMDDIFRILDAKEDFLFDLNTKLLEKLLALVGLKAEIGFTTEYVPEYGEGDFRTRIQPKYRGESLLQEYKKEKTYYQVFSSKSGFIPNLSIIDLLSEEGPNAISYIL
jgi:WbqC-like protein family.